MEFPEVVKVAGLSLTPTEIALALQTLQGPKGTITEIDFMKWLTKRDSTFSHDSTNDPLLHEDIDDNISETGSKKTISTIDSKTNPKKRIRNKSKSGSSQILGIDEVMRLNHSG